jgi:hypothetical protein
MPFFSVTPTKKHHDQSVGIDNYGEKVTRENERSREVIPWRKVSLPLILLTRLAGIRQLKVKFFFCLQIQASSCY